MVLYSVDTHVPNKSPLFLWCLEFLLPRGNSQPAVCLFPLQDLILVYFFSFEVAKSLFCRR